MTNLSSLQRRNVDSCFKICLIENCHNPSTHNCFLLFFVLSFLCLFLSSVLLFQVSKIQNTEPERGLRLNPNSGRTYPVLGKFCRQVSELATGYTNKSPRYRCFWGPKPSFVSYLGQFIRLNTSEYIMSIMRYHSNRPLYFHPSKLYEIFPNSKELFRKFYFQYLNTS